MNKPYHLTPGASQGNAFTRPYSAEPSVFCAKRADQSSHSHGSEQMHQRDTSKRTRGPDVVINTAAQNRTPGRKPGEHLFDTPPQSEKQLAGKVQIKYAVRGKK